MAYVSTHEQVADIFTKALGAEKLHMFRSLLGVAEMQLHLRGNVDMASSTRADIDGGPPG